MNQLSFLISAEPEQENIEFKTASKGRLPKDIWEVITAFSNAEGGQIVLGVRPDGTFEPLTNEDLDKLQRGIVTECSEAYNHRIYPQISVNQGTVTVYIPPSPAALRPTYSKSRGCPHGAKVRVGASNVQVDDEWIRRFAVAANGGAETLEFDTNPEEVLDQALLTEYIGRVNRARGNVYGAMDQHEVLQKLRVITKDDKVTMFGLLAFTKGAALQEIVGPTTNVAITHYRGGTKAVGDGDDPFETNKEFYGPITKQFDDAYQYLLNSLPIKGTIDDTAGKRNDYYIIPEKAIREVLANSLAHRDYSVHSSRVQIDIYSDRIEFINPGRSLIPIEELDSTPSMSRNPILMSFLKDMGYTEQRARGIKTIKEAIRNAGLIEPNFQNLNGSFVAVLYSSAFISTSDQEWLNQFAGFGLNDRQLNALAHVKNTPQGISNKEYRDMNSMDKVADDKKANRELGKLAKVGLLVKAGEGRNTRYYLSQKLD